MKHTSLILLSLALPMVARATVTNNPFLTEWKTPSGMPAFNEVHDEDVIPAVKAGLVEDTQTIDAIIANPEKPTFANTIAPLDCTSPILERVDLVFGTLMSCERTDERDAIQREMDALIVAHNAEIIAKTQLFQRVSAVYKGDQSGLTTEEKRILEHTYRDFRRAGAELSPADQARMKEINLALANLSQSMSKNVLESEKDFKKEFGIGIAEYKKAMASEPDRALRERMCKAYTGRCNQKNEQDNRAIVTEMLKLRHERARLLGYATAADYFIEPRMAKGAKGAFDFLNEIMEAATAQAKIDRVALQEIMDRDVAAGKLPVGSKLEPWDWWYYAERLRKDRYNIDDEALKRYFKLENVVKGMFLAAEKLYGIRIEKTKEKLPSYNEKETETYRILEADGTTLIGLFVTDMRARPSKASGAWMTFLRLQYIDKAGQDVRPIVINVANMSDRLTMRDVETLFHEFGHALQGLMQRCRYRASGGLNRDYIEVFSQFNEHYTFQPAILKDYAMDDDGNPIPDEIVAKINEGMRHNQGFHISELAVSALLDLRLHMVTDFANFDIEAFEKQVCREADLIDEIGLRYRSAYFKHSFAGGYSAGYYSYLWSLVLEQDLFSIFEKSGDVWNRALAEKFRRTFFEKGDSEDPMVLFRQFAGRDPDKTAFFKAKGLLK